MELENQDGILIKEIERIDSLIGKSKGLMFREEGRALLEFSYDDRHSIWMLFMCFPIDIAFIDQEKRIIDIKRDVKPLGVNPSTWKIYRPEKPCRYVLEVESGLLDEKEFKIGDRLGFKN
ncbi:MAG: DUF192 domain-containing protein [Candidatus Nanohaloarchaeota archaeon QJJ-9]|nr:DUF192 domain-containing protein [Candidatus Nanohaloarchaeota archaeon QJJ-9]